MNKYDDVRVDVAQLLRDQELRLLPHDANARSGNGLGLLGHVRSRLAPLFIGLVCKLGIYRRLVSAVAKVF